MSEHDKTEFHELINIALQPKAKTENRKVVIILCGFVTVAVMLGIDLGKWQEFKTTTVDFVKTTTATDKQQDKDIQQLQDAKNAERANYNLHIVVKQP